MITLQQTLKVMLIDKLLLDGLRQISKIYTQIVCFTHSYFWEALKIAGLRRFAPVCAGLRRSAPVLFLKNLTIFVNGFWALLSEILVLEVPISGSLNNCDDIAFSGSVDIL